MFNFVHVGFGKCFSTTLQTIWMNSLNYQYNNGLTISLLLDQIINTEEKKVADIVSRAETVLYSGTLKNWTNFPTPSENNEKTKVCSYEGLIPFFVYWDLDKEQHELKMHCVASLLSKTTDNVLILVRDPIRLIESSYAQYIKEGGYLNIAEFLQKFEIVDLAKVISIWQKYGITVSVFPVEMYANHELDFFKFCESTFGALIPNYWNKDLNLKKNQTNYEGLKTQAIYNKLLQLSFDELSSRNYANLPEQDKNKVLEAFKLTRTWGTRYHFQNLAIDDLKNTIKIFDKNLLDSVFRLGITPDQKVIIQKTYLSALKKYNAMIPFIPDYEMSLSKLS